MIDFHSHILHGVDDGSKDEDMTVDMLKLAKKSGTTGIVATPHFFRGRFQVPYEEIKKEVAKLKILAKNKDIDIEIYCGQEVYYNSRILESYKCGDIGTIENSRYMLIEFPLREFSVDEVINDIYELQLKGVVPIIAHPERYKKFIEAPELINKFIEEGFLFQLNTGSITGDFGGRVKNTAKLFVKHKLYSTIGSDGHRSQVRTTDMTAGIKAIEKINPGYVREMENISQEIFMNNKVEFSGERIRKQGGIFNIFRR
ncbi:MAG: capsular biosynthesis protein [Clostridium sulfidigenes]|uniref:protein-tyrosine-phosphatase n=1 Tax=Clostridium sulfidigenes TaxID=318464 RepID=A0A927W7J3_9CLOT|nr:capsular biosynthesis protein [Clostridium sulfidigenes]